MTKDWDLTILQMNDSHGYLEPHSEFYRSGSKEIYKEAGGYARIAGLFNKIRVENPNSVVALDNGDTVHGTFPAVNSKGKALVPILNQLNFDAMTAHWEFAYGPEKFKEITEELDYPMSAINCYDEKNDELIFPPYIVLDRDKFRLGVIGVAAAHIDKTMPDHFSEGIYFTWGNEELPEHIRHLRDEEKVDLIIVLSHLSHPQELKLSEEVDGVDVLLSGHTHNRIYDAVTVNGTILLQSGCHGSFIGRLDVDLGDGGVERFSHELVNIDESIDPDPEVEESINKAMEPHRDKLEEVFGNTEVSLNRNRVMEATMDNLLLESIREASGIELGFSNGWRYGAPVPAGPIKINDIWNIGSTDPPISTCDITGKELWKMMEENLELTFSRDPYQQMGGYVKRCSGLNIYFKIENPVGKRIQEFYVKGERLDPSKTYRACFLTKQGIPERYGKNRENIDIGAIEALKKYLSEKESVSPELRGTVVPI